MALLHIPGVAEAESEETPLLVGSPRDPSIVLRETAERVANSFYNEDAYSIQGNMMAPLVINEDVLDLVLPAGDAAGRPEDTLSIQTLQSVLSDTAHPIGRITPEKAICLPTPAPQRLGVPLGLTLVCALACISYGFTLGFTSPIGDELQNPAHGPFNSSSAAEHYPGLGLTQDEQNLFSSVSNLGALAGAPLGGFLLDRIGRPKTVTALSIPFIIGYMLIASAHSYGQLMAGRILAGMSLGMSPAVISVYVSELSPSKWRGALGSIFQTAISLGLLMAYTAGLAMPYWRHLAYIGMGPAALLTVLSLLLLPETVHYLCMAGKEEKAWLTLAFLRQLDITEYAEILETEFTRIKLGLGAIKTAAAASTDSDHDKENAAPTMNGNGRGSAMVNVLSSSRTCTAASASDDEQWVHSGDETDNEETVADSGSFAALFRGRPGKHLAILALLMAVQQFSGVNAVAFYNRRIFTDAKLKNPGVATIYVAAARFLGSLLPMVLVDRSGRRTLLLIPLIGMAASLVMLGSACIAQSTSHASGIVSVVSVVLYVVFFSLGLGSVPWLLMSEVFPSQLRGMASGLLTALNWMLSFTVTETFPMMADHIGAPASFFAFAGVCVVGTVFCYFAVPETRGKTLEMIERGQEVPGAVEDSGGRLVVVSAALAVLLASCVSVPMLCGAI